METKEYTVLEGFWLNGAFVDAGTKVQLTEAQVKYIKHNFVEFQPVAAEPVVEVVAEPEVVAEEADAEEAAPARKKR